MEGKTVRRVVALGAALAIAIGGGTGITTTGAASAARHHAPESKQTDTQAAATGARATSEVLPIRVGARAAALGTTARWGGAVNAYDLAAVNAAYWSEYASGLGMATGFTGSDSTCTVGTTSEESKAATLRAINFVRSLGGLYPVSLSADLNSRSQYTALMMSANRTLSHHPGSGWRCYTPTGAANAARSNLALAYPNITSAGLVGLYMREQGSSNYAVGHRRWLMNPFTTAMGTGATNTANSITVIGPTYAGRPNPTWVPWPTAGYFPNTLEPAGRWSLSTGSRALNFRNAKVRVYRNGALVRTVKNPVVNGYAMPTIVWQMPSSISRSGTFKVVVSRIKRAGTKKKITMSYTVRMFAPWH